MIETTESDLVVLFRRIPALEPKLLDPLCRMEAWSRSRWDTVRALSDCRQLQLSYDSNSAKVPSELRFRLSYDSN